MSFDFLITIVYLAEEQYETFVEQINASNLPKDTQFDLIEVLKLARQHTEHARKNGWLNENPNCHISSYKSPFIKSTGSTSFHSLYLSNECREYRVHVQHKSPELAESTLSSPMLIEHFRQSSMPRYLIADSKLYSKENAVNLN